MSSMCVLLTPFSNLVLVLRETWADNNAYLCCCRSRHLMIWTWWRQWMTWPMEYCSIKPWTLCKCRHYFGGIHIYFSLSLPPPSLFPPFFHSQWPQFLSHDKGESFCFEGASSEDAEPSAAHSQHQTLLPDSATTACHHRSPQHHTDCSLSWHG